MNQVDTHAGGKEEPSDANKVTYLRIQNATCASCVNKIESALNQVAGVEEATMNLAQGTASGTGNADANALVRAIESAGYSAVSR
jgi:Cu+-exporting ATPase